MLQKLIGNNLVEEEKLTQKLKTGSLLSGEKQNKNGDIHIKSNHNSISGLTWNNTGICLGLHIYITDGAGLYMAVAFQIL